MAKIMLTLILAFSLVSLSACSNMNQQAQRALSGGAIGAAGGVAITALTGGSLWTGALVGAAAGSVIGAVTSPSQVSVHK